MSGLFIRTVDNSVEEPLLRDYITDLCFTDRTKQFRGRAGSFRFGLTWINAPRFHPVYHNPDVGVSILMLGRLYDTDREERLDKEFDRITDGYRTHGIESLHPVDGAGVLVLLDHRADKCLIVMGRMGFFPLYVAFPNDAQKVRVASHPDVLAASFKQSMHFDEVTMGEFLMTGRSVQPYTYYESIRQLDPGSIYEWDRRGFRRVRIYFRPEPHLDFNSTVEQLAEELAEAIKQAVALRLRNVDSRVGVLLSGGLDSRAILFSGYGSGKLVAITFYSIMNRESLIAGKLASLASVQHVLLKRQFEYYGEAAVRAVRISAGMWNWINAHTVGFTEKLTEMELSLLLTGCYTDYLFKVLALNTEWKKAWWFPATQHLSVFQYAWYASHYRINNPKIASLAHERLTGQYAGLNLKQSTDEDRLRIEISRSWPMSREPDSAFRTIMWRTLPFDVINSDGRIVELFTRIPPVMKLNRLVFLKAFEFISPLCARVPDANTGVKPGSSKMATYTGAVSNTIYNKVWRFRSEARAVASSGSWPNWILYIRKSQVMQDLWRQVEREHGDTLSCLLGWDPFKKPLPWLAENFELFTRIMTLGLWLNCRIGAHDL